MTCLSASNLKASGKQSSSALSCSKRIVFLLIPMFTHRLKASCNETWKVKIPLRSVFHVFMCVN